MRKELLLVAAALTFGLAGGYAWSALNAPPPKTPKVTKATMIAPPPSPEEQPLAPDAEWTASADDANVAAASNGDANVEEQP